eukprot:SAG11_NODE_136_length_15118_cov_14.188495_10_plen_85_part_00
MEKHVKVKVSPLDFGAALSNSERNLSAGDGKLSEAQRQRVRELRLAFDSVCKTRCRAVRKGIELQGHLADLKAHFTVSAMPTDL